MRRSLLLNLVLALVWMTMVGSFTGTNFLVGFLVGYFIIRMVQPVIETAHPVWRLWRILELGLYFVRELFRASIQVAVDALTPEPRLEAGVIALPLDLDRDEEITFLANLISLTPGTLSLDVSEDRRTLYIHVMYIKNRDIDAERARIKRELERRVKLAFGSAE